MRKLTIILACLTLFACERKVSNKPFIVTKSDDNNWTTSGTVYCDSVDMISETHAVYWINGHKANIRGKIIKVFTNNP